MDTDTKHKFISVTLINNSIKAIRKDLILSFAEFDPEEVYCNDRLKERNKDIHATITIAIAKVYTPYNHSDNAQHSQLVVPTTAIHVQETYKEISNKLKDNQ